MSLDPDILSADPAMLEKLKAQDYRDFLKASSEREATRLAAYQQDVSSMTAFRSAQTSLFQAESAKLAPEFSLRQRILLEIAGKYMTTSTSIDPVLFLKDEIGRAHV